MAPGTAAPLMAARKASRSSIILDDQTLVQKLPSEDLRKHDLVLGALLLG